MLDLCWFFAGLENSDPIVLTWRRALDKKLTRMPLGAGVTQITRPEGLPWFFDFFKSSLLARSCNAGLYERIQEFKNDRDSDGGGILLTGSPGIGKSWFLMYTIYRLTAEPSVPAIILHSAKHFSAYWFKPDGTVSVIRDPVGVDFIPIVDKNTWYLYDANEDADECFPIRAFTVVAASPNKRHYKGFRKQMGTMRLCMPPWTLDELFAVRGVLSPKLKNDVLEVTDEEMRKRYEMAGGIPRTVFGSCSDFAIFLKTQVEQINKLSFEGISSLLALNIISDEGGNRLSHAVVKNELGDDDNGRFIDVKLSFISTSVAKLFLQAKYGSTAAGYRDAMRSALSWHPVWAVSYLKLDSTNSWSWGAP